MIQVARNIIAYIFMGTFHRIGSIFLFMIMTFNVNSQSLIIEKNLISNPGFEYYTELPEYFTEWHKCIEWNNVNYMISPEPGGSPDYYHRDTEPLYSMSLPESAMAYVDPHTENGIMGLVGISSTLSLIHFREYISTKLTKPLKIGNTYEISLYICNGFSDRNFGHACSDMAIKLSTEPLAQDSFAVINVQPQLLIDTVLWAEEWVQLKFNFIADSSYQFLTFGNFTPFEDLNIELRDSLASSTIAILAGVYYFVDDFAVLDKIENYIPEVEFPNVFTPNNDGVNDFFEPIKFDKIKDYRIQIFNRWGLIMYDTSDEEIMWDGNFEQKEATDGTYFWIISYSTLLGEKLNESGTVQLMR